MDKFQDHEPFTRLEKIIAVLRGENGCPWDKKQTPATIKKYLLAEARELAEALEQNDSRQIREETGDLYFILGLIVAMHSETEEFSSPDVLTDICDKMIRRHPHVFEHRRPLDDEELDAQWERIKLLEKSRTA